VAQRAFASFLTTVDCIIVTSLLFTIIHCLRNSRLPQGEISQSCPALALPWCPVTPVSVCHAPREPCMLWAPPCPPPGKVESRDANIQANLLATWQRRWPDWQCRQPVGKPCSQHLVGSAKEENMYSRNIWEAENLLHLHTQITPTQMHTYHFSLQLLRCPAFF